MGDTSCAILGVIHFLLKRDPQKSDQLYTESIRQPREEDTVPRQHGLHDEDINK